MSQPNRTDAEWEAVCERITAGHIPMGPGKYGTKAATWWEAKAMPKLFVDPPRSGDVILDLGCGNGRLAMALASREATPWWFYGMDPLPASIDFCREAFAPWPRYQFVHLPIRTGWTPQQPVEPKDMVIPLPDACVDWAAAISLFTHLGTVEIAERYLAEMVRVLKPGGVLWTTWFRSPPNDPTAELGRTVFPEEAIRTLHEGRAEITVARFGETTAQHDQWHVWARKL